MSTVLPTRGPTRQLRVLALPSHHTQCHAVANQQERTKIPDGPAPKNAKASPDCFESGLCPPASWFLHAEFFIDVETHPSPANRFGNSASTGRRPYQAVGSCLNDVTNPRATSLVSRFHAEILHHFAGRIASTASIGRIDAVITRKGYRRFHPSYNRASVLLRQSCSRPLFPQQKTPLDGGAWAYICGNRGCAKVSSLLRALCLAARFVFAVLPESARFSLIR